MMVVGDVQDMFMPLLDGFLCTPEESGPVIDALMQQIPIMFADTRETETVLLPAIQAGLDALKVSNVLLCCKTYEYNKNLDMAFFQIVTFNVNYKTTVGNYFLDC